MSIAKFQSVALAFVGAVIFASLFVGAAVPARSMNNSFTLDRRNAKIMGVCAGIANRTGLDVTLIRVALVLLTLCALGPIGVVAYLLAGWLAEG
ncbi:hypothetical protein LTR94_018386 [Friedmanniomyces endolithicus]|nr:hypothetical protein LTR94_018386 [Friedmanniomyces endolithicus]